MGTFEAVLINGAAAHDFYAQAAPLGVVALRGATPAPHLWIEPTGFSPAIVEVARLVSALPSVKGSTFALLGQSSADVYLVTEAACGEVVRELVFNRDDGGWAEARGAPRPWETDFHFALPLARFLDELDEEWTEAEMELAKEAYERKDLSLLPRLPSASHSQLLAFAQTLGFDLEAGPHARYTKPGLFSRLFGRAGR